MCIHGYLLRETEISELLLFIDFQLISQCGLGFMTVNWDFLRCQRNQNIHPAQTSLPPNYDFVNFFKIFHWAKLVFLSKSNIKHLCQSANFCISTLSIKTKRNQFLYFSSEGCKTRGSTAEITMRALTRRVTHLLLSFTCSYLRLTTE